ncbi:L,D-transpeptidase [Mesorhizobium sp. B2-3-5]|uniref:L,D-transpeptidase n=1 Tax=Mesorhizobium sp. B2-3-5 TaxID=2589958 RepID=UPI00112C11B9|nr:L,D-transpeptidase [Mesorhizobium sp. B2-3-5]TPM26921.1 L,D-transpeptidase [Mesorhizobium sp. B2-3-5]
MPSRENLSPIARRTLFVGAGAFTLAGCVATQPARHGLGATAAAPASAPAAAPITPLMYAALPDEPFPVPSVDVGVVEQRLWRQDVEYPTTEMPGTLIVDTPNKFLYHVQAAGRAVRYGVGVGREGFAWSGRAVVAYKRQWPRWTAPDSMVARQPELAQYSVANGGMDPGPKNPLGARALYIHKDGKDTFYRLHGTPEARSIGKSVSSGCIRLLNQDVIHLYAQVRDGSPIVVIPDPSVQLALAG